MTNPEESVTYEFDGFTIHAGKRLLQDSGGEIVALTPKVFDTLLHLVRNQGTILEKDELMSAIWPDTIVEENNLNKNISVLRRVLGETRGQHRFIATIPGRGYKFVAEVRTIDDIPSTESPDPKIDLLESHKEHSKPRFPYVLTSVGLVLIVIAIVTAAFWRPGQTNPPAADRPQTIAILPFRPLIAGDRDEALELGMADTLISRLANNRELIVRPLSSVRGFNKLDQDALQAGRSLDVASVLEGNIQRVGDLIRLNVRLIKVADNSVIWTDTFDEKYTDIFVVQDAISNRIASALALKLSREERTTLEKRYTNSAAAYAFYVRGRYHVFKITESEIRKGIVFYEQAIAADPNYALAYAGLADAYRTLASASFAPAKEVCPQAIALAKRALEIDNSISEAYIVLGFTEFLYNWDWPVAETKLKRAIELSPNNSDAHRAYAHLLSNAGRHEEAIVEGRIARELAPLTLIALALESQFLFYAGRESEAAERAQQTIEIDPNFWVTLNILGRIYLRQGRLSEAIAELRKAKELAGGSSESLMQLSYGLSKSGDYDAARAVRLEMEELSKIRFVPHYNFAMVYNGLGESDEALRYLEKSAADREIQLSFIKVDTRWDNLRSEPRFVKLMEQMKFD